MPATVHIPAPVPLSPAAPVTSSASAFAAHLIMSDGSSRFNVEVSIPVDPDPELGPPMAFVRIDVSQLLGREYGAGGFATLDLPVACLEDVAQGLADVVALAKHYGWLSQ